MTSFEDNGYENNNDDDHPGFLENVSLALNYPGVVDTYTSPIDALAAIKQADELESFRIEYLGRKGRFTALMRKLGQASPEERPRLGKLANNIRHDATIV